MADEKNAEKEDAPDCVEIYMCVVEDGEQKLVRQDQKELSRVGA